MPAAQGLFVSFEGGEGAGKTTQIERLAARLRAIGREVVTTREPGGSPRAEAIRRAVLGGAAKELGPFAEALLFSAARADHLEATIRPALARGAVVLCDRFADSTRAYQGAVGSVDPALLQALERVVVDGTRPDLTLVLDVPAELGLARALERRQGRSESADRFEGEGLDFHRRLREAFLAIAEREPERCVVVDGSGDADGVEAAIWTAFHERALRLGHDLRH